jgi:hypothetical protein
MPSGVIQGLPVSAAGEGAVSVKSTLAKFGTWVI